LVAGHASGLWHGNGKSRPLTQAMFVHQFNVLQAAMQVAPFATTRRCEMAQAPAGGGFRFAAAAISVAAMTTSAASIVSTYLWRRRLL
jgi:hypothetical protein